MSLDLFELYEKLKKYGYSDEECAKIFGMGIVDEMKMKQRKMMEEETA